MTWAWTWTAALGRCDSTVTRGRQRDMAASGPDVDIAHDKLSERAFDRRGGRWRSRRRGVSNGSTTKYSIRTSTASLARVSRNLLRFSPYRSFISIRNARRVRPGGKAREHQDVRPAMECSLPVSARRLFNVTAVVVPLLPSEGLHAVLSIRADGHSDSSDGAGNPEETCRLST